jgi:hypothetical protein
MSREQILVEKPKRVLVVIKRGVIKREGPVGERNRREDNLLEIFAVK